MKSLLLVSCFASASLLVGCGSGEGTGDDDVTVDGSVTPQPDGGQVVVPQGEKITLSASTATIPAGAEEEWCEVVELPNADAIKVHHITIALQKHGA